MSNKARLAHAIASLFDTRPTLNFVHTTALTLRVQVLMPLAVEIAEELLPGPQQAEPSVSAALLRGLAFKTEMQKARRHIAIAPTGHATCHWFSSGTCQTRHDCVGLHLISAMLRTQLFMEDVQYIIANCRLQPGEHIIAQMEARATVIIASKASDLKTGAQARWALHAVTKQCYSTLQNRCDSVY